MFHLTYTIWSRTLTLQCGPRIQRPLNDRSPSLRHWKLGQGLRKTLFRRTKVAKVAVLSFVFKKPGPQTLLDWMMQPAVKSSLFVRLQLRGTSGVGSPLRGENATARSGRMCRGS